MGIGLDAELSEFGFWTPLRRDGRVGRFSLSVKSSSDAGSKYAIRNVETISRRKRTGFMKSSSDCVARWRFHKYLGHPKEKKEAYIRYVILYSIEICSLF